MVVSFSSYNCPSAATTTSSASANMGPTTAMPTFSDDPSEGLEHVPLQTFTTIKDMHKAVNSHRKEVEANRADQYLVFRFVTTDKLVKIERERDKIGRSIRMTHYEDRDILILKVPTAKHEAAHVNFVQRLTLKAGAMAITPEEFFGLGSTRYRGRSCSKEPDAAFRTGTIRTRPGDWPTLVIECGWSESLRKLRCDARWWLSNSGGEVKTVLLLSIGRRARTMIIEKWEDGPISGNRPNTRSVTRAANTPNQPPQTPTAIQVITIDSTSNTVTGAPLTLEFRKIFLRQPVPSQEQDFTFTSQDLSNWASSVWRA
jgi:hypothetical protein